MADISKLDFKVRTINAIARLGINTVDDLKQRVAEIHKTPARKEVEEKLCLLGQTSTKHELGEWVESELGEPLTFDEVINMPGEPFIYDRSTESRDCFKVCLSLGVSTDQDGRRLIYSDGGKTLCSISEGMFQGGDFGKAARAWRIKQPDEYITESTEEAVPTEAEEIVKPEETLPPAEYTRAVILNNKILANAQALQTSLYEVCKGLKEMHDEKLYRQLGYSDFGDYAEKRVGIKRRQAYNFLKIYDTYGKSVQSIAQIGTTKLALLSGLSEEQRAEIIENTNVESTSVRELKAEIEKLKTEKLQAEKTAKNAKFREQLVSTAYNELEKTNHKHYENFNEERRKRKQLEEQVRELENRPPEAVAVEDTTEIDRLNEEIEALVKAFAEREQELRDEYEQKLKDGIPSKPTEDEELFDTSVKLIKRRLEELAWRYKKVSSAKNAETMLELADILQKAVKAYD